MTCFGVEDTAQPSTNTAAVIDTAAIVEQTMQLVLIVSANAPDMVKHRDMFYVQTGWYPEPEFQDKYHAVPITELLSLTTQPYVTSSTSRKKV